MRLSRSTRATVSEVPILLPALSVMLTIVWKMALVGLFFLCTVRIDHQGLSTVTTMLDGPLGITLRICLVLGVLWVSALTWCIWTRPTNVREGHTRRATFWLVLPPIVFIAAMIQAFWSIAR